MCADNQECKRTMSKSGRYWKECEDTVSVLLAINGF